MTWTTPAGERHLIYKDMLEQHNLLIAGQIGTGKSTLIHALIYTALYQAPGQVSFILLDPKRVELRKYASLPHTVKYARDIPDMVAALELAATIMMDRYHKADRAGVNEWTADGDLYIIVDEFADLMLSAKKQAEPILQKIGQLGRAAHVHLILATQIPSRQIITAKIKANMSSSVALHCREKIESRQIIGHAGAENLPQFGDCIYQTPSRETHYTGLPMIPETDLAARVQWWTGQTRPPVKTSLLRRLFRSA